MDRRDFIKFALLSVSMVAALAWGQSPAINVEGGMIQGVPSAASDVTVFRGIPYAAPPVGDLRWKRPQPVETLQVKPTQVYQSRLLSHEAEIDNIIKDMTLEEKIDMLHGKNMFSSAGIPRLGIAETPYGVPYRPSIWGAGWDIQAYSGW